MPLKRWRKKSPHEGGRWVGLLVGDVQREARQPFMEDLGLPDVVVYDEKRECLFSIEGVASHESVSPKRWIEFEQAFNDCKVGLV